MTKSIAVSTMVRNDPELLDLWLRHWRKFVPDENIFVLDDRSEELPAHVPEGIAHVALPERSKGTDRDAERWHIITSYCHMLLRKFDVVVHNDVDEFLVADPDCGLDLTELLATAQAPVSHAIGLEPVHRFHEDPAPLDLNRKVLRQRPAFRVSANFSKACVLTAPVLLSTGGHFSSSPELRFLPGLYNVHLRFADRELFLLRAARRRRDRAAEFAARGDTIPGFRQSAAGAEDTMNDLASAPLLPSPSLDTDEIVDRIRSTYPATPDDRGLYRFAYGATPVQQQLPARFLDLL